MVVVVLGALVAAIALAWVLTQHGIVDAGTLSRTESARRVLATLWYLLVAFTLIATGVLVAQVLGFAILLYMALVAIGLYDLSLQSFLAYLRKPLEVIR